MSLLKSGSRMQVVFSHIPRIFQNSTSPLCTRSIFGALPHSKACTFSTTPKPLRNSRFMLSSTPSNRLKLPPTITNIEKLGEYDELLLVQKTSTKEEDTNNTKIKYKYDISDKAGEGLFVATQSYEANPPQFELQLCGSDGSVLVTHKLLQGLSSQLLNMQIMCPGGLYLGSIEEKTDYSERTSPTFEVKNSRDDVVAVVLTDFAHNGFLQRSIKILAPDRKTVLGKISKQWSSFTQDNLALRIQLHTPMDASFRTSLIGLSMLLVCEMILLFGHNLHSN